MTGLKEAAKIRPCVIVARADVPVTRAGNLGRMLRSLGWDVYHAKAGPEVRRLARMMEPDLVVLDTELNEESGWLTCAKLSQERPGSLIVLLGESNSRTQEQARTVGATAIVSSAGDLAGLLTNLRAAA